MHNQLNFHEVELNVETMKNSLISNFNGSLFCKDYKKNLENKKIVFVDDDEGIPIQNWAIDSVKFSDIKINNIDIIEKEKLVFGIDSSCIKVAEVEDGSIYAIKGAVCLSFQGKPVTHIRIGPFILYLNEEIIKNFHLEHNISKLILFNDDYAKKFLRINLERYIQFWISKIVSNSIILVDGSLKSSIFESQYYSIQKVIENSVLNKNSIIGISKNSKIKILKYLSYPLLKSNNPSYVDINMVIRSLISRIYGEHVLVKFANDEFSNILRADVVSSSNDINESLGSLIFNELIVNGYPSSLQLSHNVSIFSNTDLSSIKSFIKSNYYIKEIFHENVRNSVLGAIWK